MNEQDINLSIESEKKYSFTFKVNEKGAIKLACLIGNYCNECPIFKEGGDEGRYEFGCNLYKERNIAFPEMSEYLRETILEIFDKGSVDAGEYVKGLGIKFYKKS